VVIKNPKISIEVGIANDSQQSARQATFYFLPVQSVSKHELESNELNTKDLIKKTF
jgi:hypothetical protein